MIWLALSFLTGAAIHTSYKWAAWKRSHPDRCWGTYLREYDALLVQGALGTVAIGLGWFLGSAQDFIPEALQAHSNGNALLVGLGADSIWKTFLQMQRSRKLNGNGQSG